MSSSSRDFFFQVCILVYLQTPRIYLTHFWTASKVIDGFCCAFLSFSCRHSILEVSTTSGSIVLEAEAYVMQAGRLSGCKIVWWLSFYGIGPHKTVPTNICFRAWNRVLLQYIYPSFPHEYERMSLHQRLMDCVTLLTTLTMHFPNSFFEYWSPSSLLLELSN